MKKLFTIALSVLMLISCFAISASATEVNYAQNEGAAYAYTKEDTASSWYGALADDACELLTDGIIPYMETPMESVGVQGSNKVVEVVFDLGAIYTDIKAVKFCGVWDSYYHQSSGQNRSFCGDKASIEFSEDGNTYTRNKDFEMTRENWSEDGSENGYYNYVFTFNSEVKAKAVKLTFWSPTFIMSLGEIQIIGGGADPIVNTPEESSEEEYIEDSEADTTEESTGTTESEAEASTESTAESKAEESTAESKAEESTTESKAEESTAESKAETSSDNTKEEKDGISPVVIVIIVVAVIAVAAVVVIVLKKKGA